MVDVPRARDVDDPVLSVAGEGHVWDVVATAGAVVEGDDLHAGVTRLVAIHSHTGHHQQRHLAQQCHVPAALVLTSRLALAWRHNEARLTMGAAFGARRIVFTLACDSAMQEARRGAPAKPTILMFYLPFRSLLLFSRKSI